MAGHFRQSVFGRLGGYEDVNDDDRLERDPAMRWIVGGHAVTKLAASTSQMERFETELLATDENFAALADLSGQWMDSVHDRCMTVARRRFPWAAQEKERFSNGLRKKKKKLPTATQFWYHNANL